MTSSFDDTVFNFDLDLLHHQATQPTHISTDENEVNKQHKAHKAIFFLKQNAISNDTLIRQCYQVKDMLHQKEKALFVTKQGYQEACIQYKNAVDKCSRLETDAKIFQNQNQEIKERYDHLQNQNGALQSHIKQLEAYVKEQEAIKESTKTEKPEKASIKSEINASLQKQNKRLIQDFITLGKMLRKEKLGTKYKKIMKKYEKYFKCDINDDDSDEGNKNGADIFEDTSTYSSSIEEDISNEKIPSFSIEIPGEIAVDLNTTRKACNEKYSQDDNDRFSDCSNEITSADTGRGSSLAFSDNEKCFNSPEYFASDNQISLEARNKIIRNRVDVATSTDKVPERINVATSPIDFSVHTIPTITIDKATPTITDASTSPINFEVNNSCNLANQPTNELESSPVTINLNKQSKADVAHGSRRLEKECLEVNSSPYYEDECSRDDEIERILDSMRFNSRLITPIPNTPSEISEPDIIRVSISCQTDTEFKCRCESIDVFHKELMARISDFHLQTPKGTVQAQGLVQNSNSIDLNVTNKNTTENDSLLPADINEVPIYTVIDVEREEISLNLHENNLDELTVSSEHETNDNDELRNINREAPSSNISKITSLEEETMFLSLNNEKNVQQNSSVRSRLLFEPSVDSNLDYEDNLNDSHSLELVRDQHVTPSEQVVDIRPKRKLTKLDKFKKQMVPKSKIKGDIKKPIQKTRTRSKQLLLARNKIIRKNRVIALGNKKKVTANDSSASLNDTSVYEKAVRVMAELNKKAANTNVKDVLNNAHGVEKDKKYLKRKRQQSIEYENKKTEVGDKTSLITTRSRSKCAEKTQIVESKFPDQMENTNEEINCVSSPQGKKRLKRAVSNEKQEDQSKRILRSSTRLSINENNKIPQTLNNPISADVGEDKEKGIASNIKEPLHTKNDTECNNNISTKDNINLPAEGVLSYVDQRINNISPKKQPVGMNIRSERKATVTYGDMDLFTENLSETQKKSETEIHKTLDHVRPSTEHPKDSILCHMIEKYHAVIKPPKKIPDVVADTVCKAIEDNIKKIIDLPSEECKNGMNNLIELIQTWKVNHFLAGFMKYLQDPQRKLELYSKVNSAPAPPMTKSEKIILYVVTQLKQLWPSIDIVNYILKHIEHILFRINRTPEFDTIESMSHFYALTCRYFDMRTRLRIFILNAMYCIQFKAIALIKQTLDVWMHVLPLGHMATAKSPLVLCIVYLLHFYKCEDAFHRVQDIRNILYQKYSYKMAEWNEKRILEMFKNAIKETKVPDNKKVVRLALLVLAKRQGPRWCQKNIITNMLLPMIEKEDARIKHFCVSLLGPLMKPFPVDMKVHCEIVINQLLDMANQKPSRQMEEAIFTSLMYISKHNQNRVIRALLDWHPKHVSLECEEMLCNFVREKPAHIWDRVLTKIPLYQTSNLI